jgi:hypothetical protein
MGWWKLNVLATSPRGKKLELYLLAAIDRTSKFAVPYS